MDSTHIYSADKYYGATGASYPVKGVSDAVSCQNKCELNPSCNFFSWHTNGACYLLRNVKGGGIAAENNARALAYTSGYKRCAQGEYGATWDFGATNFDYMKEAYEGVANTELCQKICLSRSVGPGKACFAWTFNFQTYECLLYKSRSPSKTYIPS